MWWRRGGHCPLLKPFIAGAAVATAKMRCYGRVALGTSWPFGLYGIYIASGPSALSVYHIVGKFDEHLIWRIRLQNVLASFKFGETTSFTSTCALHDNDFDYDEMNSQLTGRLAVLPIQHTGGWCKCEKSCRCSDGDV